MASNLVDVDEEVANSVAPDGEEDRTDVTEDVVVNRSLYT